MSYYFSLRRQLLNCVTILRTTFVLFFNSTSIDIISQYCTDKPSRLALRCASEFENKKCSNIILKYCYKLDEHINVQCNNYISCNASKKQNTLCKNVALVLLNMHERSYYRCYDCDTHYNCLICKCCQNTNCDEYCEEYC